ncbi:MULTISPECIES: TonB-dependent receptor [unclassified Bacteroides]|jgi:TonB-linked SusC/RagA family outer membrane protein|uniref:SusC/RagA family TonB-linked outer membrane protein n=1 Tax=Bacteroides TaxID=816 RepID=UPI001403C091|nr:MULTISPECIES: TonB-dependent receptor [unclassified Bacteroides]
MKKNLLITCVMLLFAITSMAQNKITISGVVTDKTGETVIGASVRVKGQESKGSITDINGKYQIVDVASNATLIFSYIGMREQEIAVNGRSTINVKMEEDSQLIDEVVVVGYGSAKKRDLTGSIVTVKADEIASKPSTNPLASIQGKVAGVQVVNTGRAGQDPEIRVRGTNSINGFKPLYVVDGLFTDNINYLNTADIESMEILKDPSSLAIFGVRGANGVIIITTKRAKIGKTMVNINSSVGWKVIYDRVGVTNAEEFKMLYNEQLISQGSDPYDYTQWTGNTDWQDEIFQTGFLTNNNVSITGATDKSKFYLGLGYVMEEGSIKTEKLNKFTVNLNSEYSVTDFLRFGFQLNGVRAKYPDAKGVDGALKAAPIAPTHDLESGLIHTLPDFQRAQVWNPLIETELRGAHNKSENYRVAGNVFGEIDILKNLTFKATFSMDYASSQGRSYSPLIYVYNPDVEGEERLTERESVNQSKSTSLAAQSDYVLTYLGQFGNHGLTLTAGLTTNYNESSSLSGGRSQLAGYGILVGDDPDRWWLSTIDDVSTATNGGSQSDRFTMSYLFRALYNYKNRYLLNASFRRDGSSVFYKTGNTWDNFYSFGAGWVMTEEKFMQNQNVINFLKLKGSWGVLGSQNTGSSYPAYATIVSSGSAVFGDNIIAGKGPNKLISPTLGWERNYSWEVGFDMHMFNDRLQLSPVYYNKTTKDMLTSIPGIAGTVPGLQNVGEIRNRGFELSASWNDKIGEDWRYGLGANLSTIDNKVLSLVNKDYNIISGPSRVSEGYPIGYFYGYKVEGVYQNEDDIRFSPINSVGSVTPGDLKFADVDGNGKITDNDRTMIGNPTPDFTYGFNVNLGWKNLDLTVDMMGVYGNEIYRNWGSSSYAQLNYRTEQLNRWHGEGTSNWEPLLDPSHKINQEASTYFIEDGSFFRIRNIELGYNFDKRLLNRIKVQSLRLYTNVQNPKTWSRNGGYTPEVGGSAISFGIDGGGYPMPTVYTIGFNLTF